MDKQCSLAQKSYACTTGALNGMFCRGYHTVSKDIVDSLIQSASERILHPLSRYSCEEILARTSSVSSRVLF